jgi:hypothetical protein
VGVVQQAVNSSAVTAAVSPRSLPQSGVPLLIIDDLGMRKLPHTAGEDLLEVMMRRYERASTLLTSNRPVNLSQSTRIRARPSRVSGLQNAVHRRRRLRQAVKRPQPKPVQRVSQSRHMNGTRLRVYASRPEANREFEWRSQGLMCFR